MLLVKTYLDKSRIHGFGVFADEFIRTETRVWRFVFGFDRFYNAKTFAKLPKPAKDYIKRYGYRWGREILFSADHDFYMNHQKIPIPTRKMDLPSPVATSARAKRSPMITANSAKAFARRF